MQITFFIAILLILVGIVGAVLPVVPGGILSILALFLLKFTSLEHVIPWWVIITAISFYVVIKVLDYLLPAYTSKKMGGSKYGIIGISVGMILGIFFSPFGMISIIILPFLGAFLGEYLFNQNQKNALQAAIGSFIGFMLSTGLSLIFNIFVLVYVVYLIYQN